MPTICPMCSETQGRCESCRKVDAAIAAHEVPAAGRRMYEAVKKVMAAKPAAKLAKKGVRNGQ